MSTELKQSTAAMSSVIISVIIPHLNQPDPLRSCLESISRQDFDLSRVEIIVVDNGSHEMPVEICSVGGNIRLVKEVIPGPGPARKLRRGQDFRRAAIFALSALSGLDTGQTSWT